ncbi:hypothetical protein GCM10020000_16570 [Streptomyces olivoverticillatus]
MTREVGEEAVIGAGAVLDGPSARMAVEAGARFLASPGLDPAVIRTGHRYGVPVFPGVATPAEILRALELGGGRAQTLPRRRPASGLGRRDPGGAAAGGAGAQRRHQRRQRPPDWIAAGAVACGMGAELSDGDRDSVAKRAGELLGRLADAEPHGG